MTTETQKKCMHIVHNWNALEDGRWECRGCGKVGTKEELGGSKLTPEQQALTDVMSGISERIWCAGWITGNEYHLWDCLIGKTTRLNDTSRMPHITDGELRVLRVLSDLVGGWIVWDDGEMFVPMAEWLEMVEAKQ